VIPALAMFFDIGRPMVPPAPITATAPLAFTPRCYPDNGQLETQQLAVT
jgi:hypothetical protein